MRIIAFGLFVIVALVAWHQVLGGGQAQTDFGQITEERAIALAFDRDAGTVVTDETGAVVASFASGDGGILEMLAVVIDHDRERVASAPGGLFFVRLHEGERLSIFDPATGRQISLSSYGDHNLAFLRGVVFQ
ncbi:MAG: photosynthetic complex assembly protein PuhC [Pseudomonadota bacterium]